MVAGAADKASPDGGGAASAAGGTEAVTMVNSEGDMVLLLWWWWCFPLTEIGLRVWWRLRNFFSVTFIFLVFFLDDDWLLLYCAPVSYCLWDKTTAAVSRE